MNLDFHDANRQIGDIERRHPCVNLKRHRLSALDKPEDIHSLAARGLRLAVKLSVLLSISLVFFLSCSSGPSSDPKDSPRVALTAKACRVLEQAGYSYDNLQGMVSNDVIREEVNEDVMGMAATITNAYPYVHSAAAFCVSARRQLFE